MSKKPPTNQKLARDLAKRIVTALFTNGRGETADRLVLTQDLLPPRNLGGWGRLPTIALVEAILLSGLKEDRP